MSGIPVLWRHCPTERLGTVRWAGNSLDVELERPMTREQIFDVFGNCGFQVVEWMQAGQEDPQIVRLRIFEFSAENIGKTGESIGNPQDADS